MHASKAGLPLPAFAKAFQCPQAPEDDKQAGFNRDPGEVLGRNRGARTAARQDVQDQRANGEGGDARRTQYEPRITQTVVPSNARGADRDVGFRRRFLTLACRLLRNGILRSKDVAAIH
jgi:hypothetical protein